VTRNPGAITFLPSENEWYKAAYYDPSSGTYFAYPAGTSTPTTCAPPTGTANRANCEAAVGNVTDVGAYTGSPSPYGTFDQGGNVFERNEEFPMSGWGCDVRGVRGGDFLAGAERLVAAARSGAESGDEFEFIGFRVAHMPAGWVAGAEPVHIDIQPHAFPNSIYLTGLPIPVAILGSCQVDVTQIDVTTLAFGPLGATASDLTDPTVYEQSLLDVNGDGAIDLLAFFPPNQTGLKTDQTEACLSGELASVPFQACDSVVVRSGGCGLGAELSGLLPLLIWLHGRRRAA